MRDPAYLAAVLNIQPVHSSAGYDQIFVSLEKVLVFPDDVCIRHQRSIGIRVMLQGNRG
jgi:hypothetical protein